MNDGSLITSATTVICTVAGVLVLWKPFFAKVFSVTMVNKASGDVITSYKEQIEQLKSDNTLLREQNDELRHRHDENVIRISSLESDLKIIKNALRVMLAMSGETVDKKFKDELLGVIGTLGDDNASNE